MASLTFGGLTLMQRKLVPGECTDSYDGSKHPSGSAWNTSECMSCECNHGTMSCCSRYVAIAHLEGCTSYLDKETCTYKSRKINDPSKPCDVP
ncbi:small serum protein 2-like [Zootoca vivipara]|uniref:small serum protein 2-like n=1 Tax=Zootoca vivipara TaxID=8524 RepID=UPI001590B4F8|nr:small serum protein 2-like [Zootoca vivipara]